MAWLERIAAAEWRGTFTEDDRADVMDFNHCAINDYAATVPRHPLSGAPVDGYPKDDEAMEEGLYLLGLEFASAVVTDNFTRARNIVAQIQERVKELESEESNAILERAN